MAYPTQGRDPLLDSNMQAALEKRGKELLGFALVALGLMAGMMIASYSPDDPNWLVATDAPVQNWMGRFGASLAAPLFMIIGWGSWGIPVLLCVWGTRFALHLGQDRAFGRLIFAPIALALTAVYAATLSPGVHWTHSFGLGGLFGDTALLILLQILPGSAALGAKLLALILGVGIVAFGAFVLGFTRPELARVGRWMLVGLVLFYAYAARALGAGAQMGTTLGARAAKSYQKKRAARREAAETAWHPDDAAAYEDLPPVAPIEMDSDVTYADHVDPGVAPDPEFDAEKARVAQIIRSKIDARAEQGQPIAPAPLDPEPDLPASTDVAMHVAEPRGGLRALMPSLLKREAQPMPEPELVQTAFTGPLDQAEPSDDRIRSKINTVIRSRKRPAPIHHTDPGAQFFRAEPKLTRATPAAMTEPPLTREVAVDPASEPGFVSETIPLEVNMFADAAVPQDDLTQALAPAPSMEVMSEPDMGAPIPSLPPMAEAVPQDMLPMGALPEHPVIEDPLDSVVEAFEPAPQAVEVPVAAPSAFRPSIPVPGPKKVVQHPPRKPIQPSTQAIAEAQPALSFDDIGQQQYEHPPLSLLASPDTVERHHLSDEALEENARMLESVLDDYGVKGEIVSVRPGPVVTMYELEPAPGLKASRVIGLSDDIARSMSALSARVSTVPGRSVIGIELPNANREKVVLREILAARDFGDTNMRLPLALGKDIGGDPVVANLAKMPHLLIAGTTGSGKSVAINTMILSLLYKLTPEECRLIMIDPKMLELSVYDGIPHLLSPVVTDPKKAVVALKWVVGEMEDRYRKMSKMGVRNIEGYNGRVRDALAKDEMFSRTVQTGFDDESGEPIFETEEFAPELLPYIVVIVDEMADLMMVAGKEIEACIQRLAQMARASGIHLIMATQRPSVDVITGTIKANFPTRISFQVTSKVDSRTILGEMGAEQLLGMGDMLYMAGGAKITRVHGPFCSDEEVEEVVNCLKSQGPPDYIGGVVDGPDEEKGSDIDLVLGLGGNTDAEDAMYDTAVQIVLKDRKCSTSYIQRKLSIGYNKAARLVEQMEENGVVSPANHVGKREILVPEQG